MTKAQIGADFSLNVRNNLVFISIAAYRDPQLIPTVEDCLSKALHPEHLRFGICWQHAPGELTPYEHDDRFSVIDVAWQASQGACWARAQAMKLWRGEQWFLQVDSHCRFVSGWDEKLFRTMKETGSPKPILSTYATPFTPGENEILEGAPLLMAFQGFTPEGIPHMRPLTIPNWQSLHRPFRARFLSAGFLFAPGTFVSEVPYDPELYFLGEEAAMTVRAFTHGYDLFHPSETIVWHDYVRKDSVKHWDDHTEANKAPVTWGERDLQSKNKIKKLLAGEPLAAFGLGSARSIQDFEEYAGLSFQLRRAQDYTSRAEEPPNPRMDSDWAREIYSWLVRIRIDSKDLPAENWDDFLLWYIGVHDEYGNEIYRRDLTQTELGAPTLKQPEIVLVCEMQSGSIPATWTVWPVSRSRGWLKKIEGKLADGDYAILREEEA
jgi:UDP-N-acetylglucosamine (GlcNAc):hydroxyproline polypeptide GlcNAc-transferase